MKPMSHRIRSYILLFKVVHDGVEQCLIVFDDENGCLSYVCLVVGSLVSLLDSCKPTQPTIHLTANQFFFQHRS